MGAACTHLQFVVRVHEPGRLEDHRHPHDAEHPKVAVVHGELEHHLPRALVDPQVPLELPHRLLGDTTVQRDVDVVAAAQVARRPPVLALVVPRPVGGRHLEGLRVLPPAVGVEPLVLGRRPAVRVVHRDPLLVDLEAPDEAVVLQHVVLLLGPVRVPVVPLLLGEQEVEQHVLRPVPHVLHRPDVRVRQALVVRRVDVVLDRVLELEGAGDVALGQDDVEVEGRERQVDRAVDKLGEGVVSRAAAGASSRAGAGAGSRAPRDPPGGRRGTHRHLLPLPPLERADGGLAAQLHLLGVLRDDLLLLLVEQRPGLGAELVVQHAHLLRQLLPRALLPPARVERRHPNGARRPHPGGGARPHRLPGRQGASVSPPRPQPPGSGLVRD